MIILIGLVGVGFLLFSQQAIGAVSMSEPKRRLFDLTDVLPENQGGNFKTDFDVYFERSADQFSVPFALLKAHAIMESSLNPRAFRDENPSGRTDRKGWASRGLMQTLFWPGSTRFQKYGFGPERDPSELFDPETNIHVAAQLIRDNLNACHGSLRDAINMYNAGVKESVRIAPHNYTDKVFNYYKQIIGG